MNGVRALTVAATALVLGGLGCGVEETIVARVGDRDIQVGEVQSYLTEASGMAWQAVDDRVASRLLDQFLDQEVMAASAGRNRVREIPTQQAARSSAVRSLVTEACGPAPTPTDAQVEHEVDVRLKEVHPARARVRQMLLPTLEEAEVARRRVAAGEPFIEVSREMSKAANALTGGELGVLTRGTLPEELDNVVFSLSEGEVSEPVRSPAGYHVFQVLDVVPEGAASRHELEPAVRRSLTDELARAHVRQCVDENQAKVGVTVYGQHLWFHYEGRYGTANRAS
jgi:parvulin-like peptidyl-prolyl isomerase